MGPDDVCGLEFTPLAPGMHEVKPQQHPEAIAEQLASKCLAVSLGK